MSAKARATIAAGVSVLLGVAAFFVTRDAEEPPTVARPVSSSESIAAVETEQHSANSEPEEVRAEVDIAVTSADTSAASAKPTGPGKIKGVAQLPADTPKTPVRIILHRIDIDAPIISFNDTLFATLDTAVDGKFTVENLPLGTYMGYALTETHTAQRPVTLTRTRPEGTLNLNMFEGGSISGRVLTPDKKPVAGASVFVGAWDVGGQKTFAPRDRALSSRQVTDEAGAFTLQYLRKSDGAEPGYRIAAQAEGYATTLSDYVKAGAKDVEVILSEGAVLNGSLVDSQNGEPIPDKLVKIESELAMESLSATSDADGFFFISNVSPGTKTGGLVDEELVVTAESAIFNVPADAASAEVTLRALKGGTVFGRVYDADSGRGMGDVPVTLYRRGDRSRKATSASDGTYRITALNPTQYNMSFETPRGYRVAEIYEGGPITLTPGGVENVDLPLSRGLSISGVVVDDTGKPIPQVNVRGTDRLGMSDLSSDPTNDRGAFSVSGFKPDSTATLYAGKVGFAYVSTEPELKGFTLKENLSGVRITLMPESTVSGTVVDSRGAPINNVWMAVRKAKASDSDNVVTRANSDATGAIAFKQLQPGEYDIAFQDLTASAPEGESTRVKVARAEAVTGLRFVRADVKGLTISGRVYDPRGNAVKNASVSTTTSGFRRPRRAQTDATGAYTLMGLEPGAHELHASGAAFAGSESVVADAGSTGIDLRLTDFAKIEGRVISAVTGQPIPAFFLNIEMAPMPIRDAEGKFTMEKVREGTQVVNISAEGYAPGAVAVADLVPGETRRGVIVRLDSGVELTGSVKGSSGQPISGASVSIQSLGGYVNQLRDARANSGDDGTFRIASLPAGQFRVYTHREGYPGDFADLTLTPGTRNHVDFVLTPGGSVTGIVTLNGKPVPAVDVIGSVEPTTSQRGVTDASGRYLVEHLPAGPGKVRAILNNDGRSLGGTMDMSVVEGQTTTVNVELTDGNARLAGTVFETPNVPMDRNVSLSVKWADGRMNAYTMSKTGGQYQLGGLPAGDAILEVNDYEGPNSARREVRVTLVDGAEIKQNVVLSEGQQLKVRVGGTVPKTTYRYVSVYRGSVPFNDIADIRREGPQDLRIAGGSIRNKSNEEVFGVPAPGIYTVVVFEWDSIKSQLAQDPYGRWAVVEVEVKSEPETTVNVNL